MSESSVAAESLLAVDVGTINTRAILFDIVEGQYRFVAVGKAKTTIEAPYLNIGEGVRRAISKLEKTLGRTFLSNSQSLIIPSSPDGIGIDSFALTISGGKPLRVVAVGILEEGSAQSAQELAATTYSRIVDVVTINSQRTQESRIDAIIKARPDLIILAGGTENGAERSVMTMVEAVGLACYLLPKDVRPEVLYVGNQALREKVQDSLSSIVHLDIAPNIRPSTNVEQLVPAQAKLIRIYQRIRNKKILGVSEFDISAGRRMLPTAAAFNRIIGFLSKTYGSSKGVLGIDIGASATTVSLAFSGNAMMKTISHLNLGENVVDILRFVKAEDIARWIPGHFSPDRVQDYLYNKTIYPFSIPGTVDELSIEQAIARQLMRLAVSEIIQKIPEKDNNVLAGFLPWVEPIIASGSVLTKAPKLGQSMLMLLDGIQPVGVTTLVLDKNNLTPALGAAAEINQMLVVQVLESKAFLNLGTVIAPVGKAKFGTPVLRVWIKQEDGTETNIDVKYGSIEVIPASLGQKVELRVLPLQRFDIGMGGPGRGGRLRVIGGALGIVIDARGRPLMLPENPNQRQELLKKWARVLGA